MSSATKTGIWWNDHNDDNGDNDHKDHNGNHNDHDGDNDNDHNDENDNGDHNDRDNDDDDDDKRMPVQPKLASGGSEDADHDYGEFLGTFKILDWLCPILI